MSSGITVNVEMVRVVLQLSTYIMPTCLHGLDHTIPCTLDHVPTHPVAEKLRRIVLPTNYNKHLLFAGYTRTWARDQITARLDQLLVLCPPYLKHALVDRIGQRSTIETRN